jgi:hypothetical protein
LNGDSIVTQILHQLHDISAKVARRDLCGWRSLLLQIVCWVQDNNVICFFVFIVLRPVFLNISRLRPKFKLITKFCKINYLISHETTFSIGWNIGWILYSSICDTILKRHRILIRHRVKSA